MMQFRIETGSAGLNYSALVTVKVLLQSMSAWDDRWRNSTGIKPYEAAGMLLAQRHAKSKYGHFSADKILSYLL